MADFNPNHKLVLDEMLLAQPMVKAGKMFGFPGYYAGKKLCICLYENGVGMKLPKEMVSRLVEKDEKAVPFQPMGRKVMREWVQINCENSQDYHNYQALFEESIKFVLALQGIEQS